MRHNKKKLFLFLLLILFLFPVAAAAQNGSAIPAEKIKLSERNGLKEVAHGGNQARVTTYLYMLPERGFAVVLRMSLESVGSRVELARQIADIVSQQSGN
jgi:hypothetical protein